MASLALAIMLALTFQVQRLDAALEPIGQPCINPTPLSADAPNVLLIGDSISMGAYGYSLFVQSMLQTKTGGTLVGSLQHGGGFGEAGQMASSENGTSKVKACMGNWTGTLRPKAWSVITYNAGLHDCDRSEAVNESQYRHNLRGIFETLKPAASTVYDSMTSTSFWADFPRSFSRRSLPLPTHDNPVGTPTLTRQAHRAASCGPPFTLPPQVKRAVAVVLGRWLRTAPTAALNGRGGPVPLFLIIFLIRLYPALRTHRVV